MNCKREKSLNTLRRSHISTVDILLEEFDVSNSGDHLADPPRSVELTLAVQEEKDMSVRKATLLEFDGVDASYHISTKDVVLTELLQHDIEL
jgi:hypothetical protein